MSEETNHEMRSRRGRRLLEIVESLPKNFAVGIHGNTASFRTESREGKPYLMTVESHPDVHVLDSDLMLPALYGAVEACHRFMEGRS